MFMEREKKLTKKTYTDGMGEHVVVWAFLHIHVQKWSSVDDIIRFYLRVYRV